MIDGLKIWIDGDKVKGSDVLEFCRIEENRHEAKYKGMIVTLYPDRCYVRGSIHKYKNNGEHNSDDFFLSDFVWALGDLAASLNFNPEITTFCNLEFGVNIELPFDARTFIDSIVYCNGGDYSNNEKGITINFCEWDAKFYLKEKRRENDGKPLLRCEISVNTTRRIKKIVGRQGEIYFTLQTLTDPFIWRSLGDYLLKVFDSLLIVDRDSIDIEGLSTDEVRLFVNATVPGYWLKKWEYGWKKKRELEKLKNLIQKHSSSTMKKDVRSLIEEKINSLIDIQNVTKSPFGKESVLLRNHRLGKPDEGQDLLRNHRLGNKTDEAEKGQKCYEITAWITGDFVTSATPENPSKRLCSVTGLSLEIPVKQNSYLSAKGVEFYYKNFPEIYEKILAVRLSKKWLNSDLQIQFREIAHSIRNERYNPNNNPRNNFKRSLQLRRAGGQFLFPLAETIREDKLQYLDAI